MKSILRNFTCSTFEHAENTLISQSCLSLFSVCLFVCLFGFLTSSSTTRLYRGRAPRQERLTILRAATHETELGDHDFCLSRSHYTDTDPTCRERAATAGIEPGTSSPGVARSTAELPRPPLFSELSLFCPIFMFRRNFPSLRCQMHQDIPSTVVCRV